MSNNSNSSYEFTITAIYGSPRKGGNSSLLLDSFIEGAAGKSNIAGKKLKINKVVPADMDISPCRECSSCSKTGKCIIKDDMQPVYGYLTGADFIAVASPVFFTTVSGYLKALIDRCQRFWSLKYEHKKRITDKNRKGIFISTAGSGSPKIFDCPRMVIRSFFDVLYIDYFSDFLFNNVDKKGDILKNREAMEVLYNFGKEKIFPGGSPRDI